MSFLFWFRFLRGLAGPGTRCDPGVNQGPSLALAAARANFDRRASLYSRTVDTTRPPPPTAWARASTCRALLSATASPTRLCSTSTTPYVSCCSRGLGTKTSHAPIPLGVARALGQPHFCRLFCQELGYTWAQKKLGSPVLTKEQYNVMNGRPGLVLFFQRPREARGLPLTPEPRPPPPAGWPVCKKMIAACQNDTSKCPAAQGFCNEVRSWHWPSDGARARISSLPSICLSLPCHPAFPS